LNTIAIISLLLCTVLVGFFSWLKSRKIKITNTTSLFLANRNNSFWLVAGSLFLSNLSANQFIGENESVYLNNMTIIGWGVSSVLAMLVVSEFLMPVYFMSGVITTPDFLEARYDKGTKRLVSTVFLLSYIVNMLPTVLYTGAVAFNGMFNINEVLHVGYWQGIWILVWGMGIIGCAYCIMGGLKAISVSDSILSFGMLIIAIILPLYGLRYLGEGSITEGIRIIVSSKTTHLNAIGTAADAVPFSTIFTGMLIVNIYYWGMEQYIVQQSLSAKNLSESQKGIALACVAKLLSPLLINVPGLIAVHLYPDLINTAQVFPLLIKDALPAIFIGLTGSVIFGSAITVYNAGLNSSSTLFILNIYKPWKSKQGINVAERELVKTAKLFEVVISLLAMFIAPFFIFANKGFYMYLQEISGIFSIPIFTIILVGMITKKVPAIAAKAAIVFYILCYVLLHFLFPVKMHFLHLMAILFIVTMGIMLLIGKLYPMAQPYEREKTVLKVVHPWKYRYYAAAILIILMVLVFVIFSPLVLAKS